MRPAGVSASLLEGCGKALAAPQSQQRIRRRLSAVLADDRPDGAELTAALDGLRESEDAPTFSLVLQLLAHVDLPEAQAERVVRDLLGHRERMREALGRDPGLRVSTIDYLSNVERLLDNPTIVESVHLERTERSAVTDALTGLGNRRHFSSCLSLEIRRSRRYGLRMSLLMLDLDEFKRLNDLHGHLFGDLMLQRLGRSLRTAVREADVASRYGGEEFAVILPETDRLGAYAVGERVRRCVEQDFAERAVAGRKVALTLSGGVAAYPEDARDAAGLIERADQALYLAKRCGKNRIGAHHAERRAAVRFPVKKSTRASISLLDGGEALPVNALNLSRVGALLELPEECAPSDSLELTLGARDATGRPRTWVRRGKVVRVEKRPAARSAVRVAVSFEEPLDEEGLRQQVRYREPLRPTAGGRA